MYNITPPAEVVKPLWKLWVEQVLEELKPRETGLTGTTKLFKLMQLIFA